MQARHTDRERYFEESAATAEKYYVPLLAEATGWRPGAEKAVLEVGCGEGGNLVPFARRGCRVTGIDLHEPRTAQAREFFARRGLEGEFVHTDVFAYRPQGVLYDLIILHDVIEHIGPKQKLLERLKTFLAPRGRIFLGFPPWQMPFGGHQQMAAHKLIARAPFIHLLPAPLYRFMLRAAGETQGCIDWLFDTKATRITPESFRRLAHRTGYRIILERRYLVNPHYEVKFGLAPRRLPGALGAVPVLRNLLTTTCYCILESV